MKRVIARGGDNVHIIDGRVSVNGTPLEETYVGADARSADTHGPELVKEAHYFVMGDRRNNSSDSRHWDKCLNFISWAESSCAGPWASLTDRSRTPNPVTPNSYP